MISIIIYSIYFINKFTIANKMLEIRFFVVEMKHAFSLLPFLFHFDSHTIKLLMPLFTLKSPFSPQLLCRSNFGTVWVRYQLGITVLR